MKFASALDGQDRRSHGPIVYGCASLDSHGTRAWALNNGRESPARCALANRLAVVLGRLHTDAVDRYPQHHIRPLADNEVDRVGAVLGLARLYQGNGLYLVAWQDEEPLGHAYIALTDPPELEDVSVRPEYRRLGIGSALTSAAERVARDRGFGRLRLEVSQDNSAARALYGSCGYAEIGAPPRRVQGTVMIRTGAIEVDDTLLTWEKSLTQDR
jgi:ribosomal protein S18 acetylase RimI-like enzyme